VASANRNVSIDITGDTRDLEQSYDRVARKSEQLANDVDKNNKKMGSSFSDVAKTATSSFDDFSGTVTTFGKTGPIAIGAVAAAIAALPTIINLAAGAVTLGFGAALAGIGIAAASQSAVVRQEFKDLWDGIKSDLYDISGPIEKALLNIRGYADRAFENFLPSLEEGFKIIGPAIDKFGADFSRALLELEPAIKPLSNAFAALLSAIGERAPNMFRNLSASIENLASIAERNADDIAGFIDGAFSALEWTTARIDDLSSLWDEALAKWEDGWNSFIDSLNGGNNPAIDAYKINISDTTDRWNAMAEQLKRTAEAAREAQDPLKQLKLDVDVLKDAIDELNGVHIASDRAMLQWQQTLWRAVEATEKSSAGLKYNTKEGRDNWQAVLDMADAGNRLIESKAEEGATVKELAVTYSQLQTDLMNVIKNMGESGDKARELAKRYLEIPDEIRTRVGLETLEAQRKFDEYITLNSGRQIPVYLIQKQEMPAKDGGYFGYASGGPVKGPGGSRTDSIPARISRGEYVVNAAATRRNLPLLEAINSGKGVGGMGTTIIYQINTSVAPTANLSAIGQEIVESIQAFESRSGKTWRMN